MGGKKKNIFEQALEATTNVVGAGVKAVDDTMKEVRRGTEGKWDITGEKERAKQEARDDRAAASAAREAEKRRVALIKARGEEAALQEGADVLLGAQDKKTKKNKSQVVSSGLGIAKGDTGLQV